MNEHALEARRRATPLVEPKGFTLSRIATVTAVAVSVFVLLTGLLVTRIHRAGVDALAESERAFDAGDLSTATTAAREALTWYIPGAPHVSEATARLRAIAIGAEASGDPASALRAWEALRGALFETAHPWSDSDAAYSEASAGVARLLAQQSRDGAATSRSTYDETELAALYQAPQREAGRDWFAVASSAGMLLMLVFGALALSGRQSSSAVSLVFTRAGLLVGVTLWVLAAVGY